MGRSELIARIVDTTGMEASEVGTCLNALFPALADLLKRAEPGKSGKRRAEIHGGVIATLKKVAEKTHHGLEAAEGVVEPEHYRVDLKLHKGALDRMSAIWGMEVKNG